MLKNYTKAIGLFSAIALLLRRATRFLLTGAILLSFGMAILPGGIRFTGAGSPSANPFTYTVNGFTVVRRSELGPLTGTIINPPPRHGPGHDYGAIDVESDPPMNSPAISSFTYTVNGFTVVRRSELGPLTGSVNDALLTRGPGHDFGVLGDEYNSVMSQSSSSPIAYMVNGYRVVRRSELGPLN